MHHDLWLDDVYKTQVIEETTSKLAFDATRAHHCTHMLRVFSDSPCCANILANTALPECILLPQVNISRTLRIWGIFTSRNVCNVSSQINIKWYFDVGESSYIYDELGAGKTVVLGWESRGNLPRWGHLPAGRNPPDILQHRPQFQLREKGPHLSWRSRDYNHYTSIRFMPGFTLQYFIVNTDTQIRQVI